MQYSMFDKDQEFSTDGLVYSKGGWLSFFLSKQPIQAVYPRRILF